MLILNNIHLSLNYDNYPKTGEIDWLSVDIDDHLHIQTYENKELELPILEKYSPKPGIFRSHITRPVYTSTARSISGPSIINRPPATCGDGP